MKRFMNNIKNVVFQKTELKQTTTKLDKSNIEVLVLQLLKIELIFYK